MSKVFIIANNYTAKLIVSNLEYILNDSITEIYLLAENHFPNDTYPFSSAKITLCKNIHEGIANSDVIIMAKTKHFTLNITRDVRKIAFGSNKTIIEFDDPWLEESICTKNNRTESLEDICVPLILVLSTSKLSQVYCLVILIRRILLGHGLRVKQIYTENTDLFIREMSRYDILNKSFINNSDENFNAYIVSLNSNILEYSHDGFDEAYFINRVNPDYVILSSDVNVDKHSMDVFKYRCGFCPNILISSQYGYSMVGDAEPVIYQEQKRRKNKGATYICDRDLYKKIENELLSKITLPDDVTLINTHG